MTMTVADAVLSVAESVHRLREEIRDYQASLGDTAFPFGDAVVRDAIRAGSILKFADLAEPLGEALRSDPAFARLVQCDGALGFRHAYGGNALSAVSIGHDVLSVALRMEQLLGGDGTSASLATRLEQGVQQLRTLLDEGRCDVHLVTGMAGAAMRGGRQAALPTGVLRGAPEDGSRNPFDPSPATLLYARSAPARLIQAADGVDWMSAQPTPAERAEREADRARQERVALACAFATASIGPVVPISRWTIWNVPFDSGWGGTGGWLGLRRHGPQHDLSTRTSEVIEWSETIEGSHHPRVEIAVSRLISAAALRASHEDALIDAMIVWESLVGAAPETTFRVTGALAKLLCDEADQRLVFQKQLKDVYGVRSKVVHGASVTDAKVEAAAQVAIQVATDALAESYRRGSDWLRMKSEDRVAVLLVAS